MKGGIVKVSVPYVAGMTLASLLRCHMDALWVSSVALLLSVAATSVCVGRKVRSPAVPGLVFFFLGLFCYSATLLTAPLESDTLQGMLTTSWLETLIDHAGFDAEGTVPLLKAMLTGHRESMDKGVLEAFRSSGASHVLALSGLHLGVIYSVVRRALCVLGNSPSAFRLRAALTVTLCGVYAAMTGFGPSITRAFLFVALNETARLMPHRTRKPVNILCSAALVQLTLDPLVLDSLGFQLSYLAMLGIYVLYPKIDAWYPESSRFDPVRKLWSSMALTVSCQLFTAPLVWMRFHTFPQYFLLTNLVALPLSTALLSLSVAALLLSVPGCCPHMLIRAVDMVAGWLMGSLRIIADM